MQLLRVAWPWRVAHFLLLDAAVLFLCRPGESGAVHKDYWLTDGLYGSFNCILYDDQKPHPLVSTGTSPRAPPRQQQHHRCQLFVTQMSALCNADVSCL